jgi:D-aspartate ligase
MLAFGRRLHLDGWVLFPTRDETVAAVSLHRHRLLDQYRVPTPGWDTVRWACDKRNTYELASRLGIAVPRTWHPSSVDELDMVDGSFPLALKPAVKEHFVYATKAKAWRVEDRDQLRSRFSTAAALAGPEGVMVQEVVPGDGRYQYAYCAFFKGGTALGSMVVRRRRQHPPEFGRASTYVETIDLPEIEELSLRFLREIDYYGLVEIEYKHDERDGAYKLLDVNARTWGYHSLGARAGVDFVGMLFEDQLGGSVVPRQGRPGVRWMRTVTDLPTSLVEMRRGALSMRGYVRSLRGVTEEAVFSRRDPLPGLAELALLPYLAIKRGF